MEILTTKKQIIHNKIMFYITPFSKMPYLLSNLKQMDIFTIISEKHSI